MTQLVKKLAAVAFLLLLGLWAGGVVRGYAVPPPEPGPVSLPVLSAIEEYRASMRTANNLRQVALALTPLPQILDLADIDKIRVYEKLAQLTSATAAFDADAGRIRQAVADHKASISSERAAGVAPGRVLALGIGVHPDRFDALLHELSGVGQIGSITVQQQDRTGDFRRQHAQRQSLKKHQEALLKLRGAKTLSVDETLKLEQRILEAEKEIQFLGVQLGDLLDKEPSYNLFVTLQEYQPGSRHDPSFTFPRRLGHAALWALGWWVVAVLGLAAVVGTYLSVRSLRPSRVGGATAG
jgi:hypothetical protein